MVNDVRSPVPFEKKKNGRSDRALRMRVPLLRHWTLSCFLTGESIWLVDEGAWLGDGRALHYAPGAYLS